MRGMGLTLLAVLAVTGCTLRPPGAPGQVMGSHPRPGAGMPAAAATEARDGSRAPAPETETGRARWDAERRQVLPVVMGPTEAMGAGDSALLMVSLLDAAVIAFVVDRPEGLAYATAADLNQWAVGYEECLAAAVANLARRSAPPRMVADPETGHPVWVYARGDGYDAARILMVPMWQELRRQVEGRLLIAIPNRDVLYAFSDRDPVLVAHMRERTRQDFVQLAFPITLSWFEVTEDGLALYHPS